MRTITPKGYAIPMDGPVGSLIGQTAISHFRPAHVHFLLTADGYEPLITHLFEEGAEYLDSDVVFGTKQELVVAVRAARTRRHPGRRHVLRPVGRGPVRLRAATVLRRGDLSPRSAARGHRLGQPRALPDQVVVDVLAAPITPLDLLCATGTSYFGVPVTPYVPGVQGVGTVDGRTVWFPTVAGMAESDGSMAAKALAHKADLVFLPDASIRSPWPRSGCPPSPRTWR